MFRYASKAFARFPCKNMSVVRRWARRLSRRKSQQLLVSASPHHVHENFKQKPVCRQGSTVAFGPCRQQEKKFFLAAFQSRSSARALCSSSVCLHPMESAVECLKVCHVGDPQVDDGIASMEVSSHITTTDVHDIWEHQSVNPDTSDIDAPYVGMGVLALQESANMEVKCGFLQASMASGSTGVINRDGNIATTSLACDLNEAPRALQGRDNSPYDEQGLGLNCDNGEDDVQAILNSGGSSKPVVSSQDAQIIQDICALLDSKGWDANTEEFLRKTYAPHLPQSIVAIVINKQTRLSVAKSFFEWACRQLGHDPYSYQAFLWKLGLNKQYDEMWELLNKMKEVGCQVSETTFCILIKAYGAARNPDMAVTAFKRMHVYGIVAGNRVFTTLISVFFKLKLIDEALLCYNLIIVDGVNLDKDLLSTLIRGFGITGRVRDAQACFDMMLSSALELDLSTLNNLIEGFCCCNAMESAVSSFQALEKRGFKPNTSSFNEIIKGFCKDGKLEDAMSFFVDMKGRDHIQPNQATYNILLHGMVAKEEISRAVIFFKQMEEEGFVDSRSFIYLSNGFRKAKKTPNLLKLLTGLFNVHGFSNTEVCNALIYHLSHSNALDKAKHIFRGTVNEQMHTSIPSYAMMISCYCRARKLEEAIQLLAELKGRNSLPSASCYTPIITLLLRNDRATEALKYVKEMHALGLEVNHINYEDLLKVMCKQGMVEDSMKIYDIMMTRKFTVSADTLFELLKFLSKLHSVEFATSYFRSMYKQQALLDCKAVSQAVAVLNLYTNEE